MVFEVPFNSSHYMILCWQVPALGYNLGYQTCPWEIPSCCCGRGVKADPAHLAGGRGHPLMKIFFCLSRVNYRRWLSLAQGEMWQEEKNLVCKHSVVSSSLKWVQGFLLNSRWSEHQINRETEHNTQPYTQVKPLPKGPGLLGMVQAATASKQRVAQEVLILSFLSLSFSPCK